MFKLFSRLLLHLFSNLIALEAATYFIPGFKIAPGFVNFLGVAVIFTLINAFLRPIFKLIFTPVIILTLGLGVIFVNMLMLYFLDFLSPNISIAGLGPLLYATLLVSFLNILINFSAKRVYQDHS